MAGKGLILPRGGNHGVAPMYTKEAGKGIRGLREPGLKFGKAKEVSSYDDGGIS